MNRNVFLQRIANAATRGRAHRVRDCGEPPEPTPTSVPDSQALCELLVDELKAVGVTVETVDGWEAAGTQLNDWLAELQPQWADAWNSLDATPLALRQRLSAANAKMVRSEDSGLSTDVGITGVDWAIAESGTLVLVNAEQQSRRTAIAARVHIAFVRASQVVANIDSLIDPWRKQFGEAWPANITMITGPSKTGDIELKLTRGVHGPEEVRVVLVHGV